jgi:hypothetical protein
MSISVKGRLAIVVLMALACFASSVLKLYLGLLCISLLISFAVVGLVAWLVERLPGTRSSGYSGLPARHYRHRTLLEDSQRLSVTTVERVDTPTLR